MSGAGWTDDLGSRGLMTMFADIAEDQILAFREWHNCEHMTERCGIPGFNVGRRYCGLGDAPTFLMYYETDNVDVLASPAYHDRLNNPTPWTRASLPLFRNPNRTIFGLLAASGTPAGTEAPYVTTCRFNLDAADREAREAWHVETWMPEIAGHDSVIGVRFYRADDPVSGIMTEERKIYGGGRGSLDYLVMVETWTRACPDLSSTPESGRTDQVIHAFWLDMALYAPEHYGAGATG